jgi:hypothetical protein
VARFHGLVEEQPRDDELLFELDIPLEAMRRLVRPVGMRRQTQRILGGDCMRAKHHQGVQEEPAFQHALEIGALIPFFQRPAVHVGAGEEGIHIDCGLNLLGRLFDRSEYVQIFPFPFDVAMPAPVEVASCVGGKDSPVPVVVNHARERQAHQASVGDRHGEGGPFPQDGPIKPERFDESTGVFIWLPRFVPICVRRIGESRANDGSLRARRRYRICRSRCGCRQAQLRGASAS